jgi:hypothetical protein
MLRITGYAFSRTTPRKSGPFRGSKSYTTFADSRGTSIVSRSKSKRTPKKIFTTGALPSPTLKSTTYAIKISFGATEGQESRKAQGVAATSAHVYLQNMPDSLSDRYAELLTGSYDCVDRIVLNAFFRMGHGPGGFRVWWQALTGSEETLDNAHLMRLAGRFSRRIHGYAKANGIPVVHCPAGERKHELAEEYLAKTNFTQGLFLILVGRAQAPVWDVSANRHIEPKKPMPYVNHYSFHILDPQWGHITIKISGHPPFPAQVILNGHEYVACQARKAGITFTKEGNCFTQISDAAGLAKIADTLSGPQAIGRLNQVCESKSSSATLLNL